MSRLFKAVVLYLLMLAIPAQGFAASSMLLCSPARQGTISAQASEGYFGHGHADIAVANHRDHSLSASRLAVPTAGAEGVDSTVAGGGLVDSGGLNTHECGACSACCVGSAIPAYTLKLDAAAQTNERIVATPFRTIGFVTDGPRRPPRSFPA